MLNSIISSPLTLQSLVICMLSAIVLGILTSLVFSFKSSHSTSFSLTLALVPMVVCLVIMMVNGNIGVGVAVAGTFTLVRFRSVPGTAKEISAIFTAMAIGLILGMGFVGIAVLFFSFAAILTIILTLINFGGRSELVKQLRITIPENFDYNGLFDETFAKYTKKCELIQVRTTNMGTLFELTYRVTLPGEGIPKEFIDDIRSKNGNLNVILGDFEFHEVL